jgi:hypothetical protein
VLLKLFALHPRLGSHCLRDPQMCRGSQAAVRKIDVGDRKFRDRILSALLRGRSEFGVGGATSRVIGVIHPRAARQVRCGRLLAI